MILLFVLLVVMLLTGAGFGPPVVGLIAASIALKKNSPLKAWSGFPAGFHGVLSALWPWSFAVCIIAWLMVFPGTAIVAFKAGSDDPLLMVVPILIAFALIPITLLLGFSRDIVARRSPLR